MHVSKTNIRIKKKIVFRIKTRNRYQTGLEEEDEKNKILLKNL